MRHPAIPVWHELAKETLIVLGGAVIAAFIVGQFPSLRSWMLAQWADTPRTIP